MIEHKACPVCMSKSQQVLGQFQMSEVKPPKNIQQAMINSVLSYVLHKNQLNTNTVRCKTCKHVYLSPSFDGQELDLLYSPQRTIETKKQYRHSEDVSGQSWMDQNTIETESSCLDRPYKLYEIVMLAVNGNKIESICDFGGRTGELTACFKSSQRFVYDKDLSELSDPDVQGLSSFEDFIKRSPYDLLVLSHVMEHVPYPTELLKSLVPSLSNNGMVYIEVPIEYCGSVIRRRGIPLGPHVNYFTKSSLLHCLESAGFKRVCAFKREVASYNRLRLPVYKVLAQVKPGEKCQKSVYPFIAELLFDSFVTWRARYY